MRLTEKIARKLAGGLQTNYERAFGWYGSTSNESEMARSSECAG